MMLLMEKLHPKVYKKILNQLLLINLYIEQHILQNYVQLHANFYNYLLCTYGEVEKKNLPSKKCKLHEQLLTIVNIFLMKMSDQQQQMILPEQRYLRSIIFLTRNLNLLLKNIKV